EASGLSMLPVGVQQNIIMMVAHPQSVLLRLKPDNTNRRPWWRPRRHTQLLTFEALGLSVSLCRVQPCEDLNCCCFQSGRCRLYNSEATNQLPSQSSHHRSSLFG